MKLDMIRNSRLDGVEDFFQHLLAERFHRSQPETQFWPIISARGHISGKESIWLATINISLEGKKAANVDSHMRDWMASGP